MIQAVGIDQIAQHVIVFIVALIAALVVARRVFGVFERRPSGASGSSPAGTAAPGCSHCAAGNAAAKKLAHR